VDNLLIINQYASTPKYSSGAGERHYYLANKINHTGINSIIVSSGFNHLFLTPPKTDKLFTEEVIDGGKILWVKQQKYNSANFIGRVFSWFDFAVKLFFIPRKKIGNPKLVLVSSMSIFPFFYAVYLKKRLKIPFILEIRDIWPLTPIQLGGFSPSNPLIKIFSLIEKVAYRNADAIITLLPSFSKHLENLNLSAKPVYWIPNAIDDQGLQDINICKKAISKNSTNFIIVYTGALGVANAMDCFIEASKILEKSYPDIIFEIIGNGTEKGKLQIKASNQKNIIFKNKIQKSEVLKVLAETDACFISWQNIPMYDFGVSANKYNDYMLASKPIISASNISDDPVSIAKCGFQVPSGDARAIADAILSLYEMSNEERNKIGERGYEYVMKNNTFDVISAKYIKCIEDVCASKLHITIPLKPPIDSSAH